MSFYRAFFVIVVPLLLVVPASAAEKQDLENQFIGSDVLGNDVRPAYFRVSDVGDDGSLKIRVEPVAGAEVIGEYALEAGPIEILKIENGWGYVIVGEGNGWVNMAHLNEIDVPKVGGSYLPQGLICAGTEPFWYSELSADEITYSRLDDAGLRFSINEAGGFEGRVGPNSFIQASMVNGSNEVYGPDSVIYAVVLGRQCSDGMSDRVHGWWVNLLVTTPRGTSALDGCCSLR
ncbi:hypothetical protein MNBD_ALPHA11-1758 [hydrothermal vent metagenome]|uniref:SH3b domain-containing protein n=1 Tax=hydrothermal vent metagenome TaxID=652676 RepID=A0A3B0UM12_9ZZZZ